MVRVLDFFVTTQEADGHWPQNMWLDGSGFWKGLQLDEVAARILLFDLASRHLRLSFCDLKRLGTPRPVKAWSCRCGGSGTARSS